MNINKDNYEIWFLDYAEGNLTETQLNELKIFVEQHPELKAELDSFEVISLSDVDSVFPDKDILKKKSSSRSNDFVAYHEGDLNEAEKKEVDQHLSNNPLAKIEFDQLAKMYLEPNLDIKFTNKSDLQKKDDTLSTDDYIAYHEGDLNEHNQSALLAYIQKNEEAKIEFDRLANLYLIADGNIVYPNKANLKKKEGKIIFLNWQYIAAAASILLILTMIFFQKETDLNNGNPIVKNEDVTPKEESPDEDFKKLIPIENKNINNGIAVDPENIDEATMKAAQPEKRIPAPIKKTPSNLANVNQSEDIQVTKKVKDLERNNSIKMALPVIMESKSFESIALESEKPQKLKPLESLPQPKFSNENTNDLAETNSQQDSQPITVLAFVEQKAANMVSDEKRNKLRLFDVLKKVGEKSRLYDLEEAEDNKFSLKIAKVELEGNRNKVTL